jgi:hypothetical protein
MSYEKPTLETYGSVEAITRVEYIGSEPPLTYE